MNTRFCQGHSKPAFVRRNYFQLFAAVILVALATSTVTQAIEPGDPDLSFNASVDPSYVFDVARQPDGELLIVGRFQSIGGVPRDGIARLNSDGSLDSSFAGPDITGAVGPIRIALQPDGKILIVGGFQVTGGPSNLVRLNSDGSIDRSFNVILGFSSEIFVGDIEVLSNGQLLASGAFTSINGVSRVNLARLNADGSVDTSFDAGSFAQGPGGSGIGPLEVLSDGRILVGGYFQSIQGVGKRHLARLLNSGAVDLSFNAAGTGPDAIVRDLTVQSDGKIVIVGDFGNYNGVARNFVARINSDGSLDTIFDPANGADKRLWAVEVQADGRIFIGGEMTRYNGQTRNLAARLNPDGSLDNTFFSGSGFLGGTLTVYDFLVQSDNRVIVAGDFTEYNGINRQRMARFYGAPTSGPPNILTQPQSQTAVRGKPFTLSVTAGGSSPLSYQWNKDGQPIPGATSASLSISSAQHTDAGNYTVVVSNAEGSPTSNAATVTVIGVVEQGATFTRITSGGPVDDGNGPGMAWGDFNNDGLLDLFIARGRDGFAFLNSLYRNNGDGTFTTITGDPVVTDVGESMGGGWADYDNDGHLDLFVDNVRGPNFLYHNNGNATFSRVRGSPFDTDMILTDTRLFVGNEAPDTFSAMERITLRGGPGNNGLYAYLVTAQSSLQVRIFGEDGDDIIMGGAGNDQLVGGAGVDTITSGLGSDTIDGGSGGDDLIEEFRDADMTLTDASLQIGSETDTFVGIERVSLFGGPGQNRLDASQTTPATGLANVRLIGRAGDDTLLAGSAAFYELVGESGNDRIDGGASPYSTLLEYRDADMTLTDTSLIIGAETDTIVNIDSVTLIAGPGNNRLDASQTTGATGIYSVRLIGGAGNDVLLGGSCAFDELFGDSGNDRFVVQNGWRTDSINDSGGIDTLDFSGVGPAFDAKPQDAVATGNLFRLAGQDWHFNVDTKATGMSAGIWQLIATLSDGSQHSVWIQIK